MDAPRSGEVLLQFSTQVHLSQTTLLMAYTRSRNILLGEFVQCLGTSPTATLQHLSSFFLKKQKRKMIHSSNPRHLPAIRSLFHAFHIFHGRYGVSLSASAPKFFASLW